jgi:hypothetical protein
MDSAQTVARGLLGRVLVVVLRVVGLMMLGIILLLLLLMWSCASPSDKSLTKRFQRHRSQLETLVRMSQEDVEVIRVADNFTRVKDDWSWPRPESKWGITLERWNEYRRLFRKVGLNAGLEKDKVGNVYLIAHTEGIVAHGRSKGLVYCISSGDSDSAYLPCAEQHEEGQQGHHDGYGGYSYRKLTQNWYIFEQWN